MEINPYTPPSAHPGDPVAESLHRGLRWGAGIASVLMILLLLFTFYLTLAGKLGPAGGPQLLGSLVGVVLFSWPYYRGLQSALRPVPDRLRRSLRSNFVITLFWGVLIVIFVLGSSELQLPHYLSMLFMLIPSVLNLGVGLKVKPVSAGSDSPTPP
jgi:hypothetical protein